MNNIKRNLKLLELAKLEGFDDVTELLKANTTDSVVPGICITDGCSYTDGVEPDQCEGYCEECDKQTVQSCLILAQLI